MSVTLFQLAYIQMRVPSMSPSMVPSMIRVRYTRILNFEAKSYVRRIACYECILLVYWITEQPIDGCMVS